MNKELIYTQDGVVVNTDNGLEKRDDNNNIEEILITENNIEEIENKINDLKDGIVGANYKKLLETTSLKYIKNFLEISIPASILVFILAYTCFSLSAAINTLPIIALTLIPGCGISSILATTKVNKLHNIYSKRQLNLLENELENQKQKLNELNSKKIINNNCYNSKIGKTKKIDRSKLIEDLKIKLKLIEEYQPNSKQYVEYAKDHFISIKLKDMGYSESDVNFIQELIEEDTKNENYQKKINK